MADAKGYITAGEYPGDGLAEVFLELGQQDPTLSGCLDAFEQRDALGIFTLEERTRMLDEGSSAEEEPAVPTAPTAKAVSEAAEAPKLDGGSVPVDHDAPMCFECGIKMKRAGACHVCESCGTTSGCS